MSSEQALHQAIQLIQSGNQAAGVRMLKATLKQPDLSVANRAIGYVWLAEYTQDINEKIQHLRQAHELSPDNPQIKARLDAILAQQPQRPTIPLPGQPPPPNIPNPALPDSQPIRITSPDMSESQQMRAIRSEDFDSYQGGQSSGTSGQNARPAPMQPQTQRSTYQLHQAPLVVGIHGVPNGNGSGIFVTNDGLIATTRYVVGASREVRISLDTGHETTGQVLRTYPQSDLALIYVNVSIDAMLPYYQLPAVPEGEPFTALSYDGMTRRGTRRKTKTALEPEWIPTSLIVQDMANAGGDAMYTQDNRLLGILTHNFGRDTGFLYGLHIISIYEKVNQFIKERQQMHNAGYCHGCGNLTRAEQYGGYYCETCGTTLPSALNINRKFQMSPQLSQLYGDNLSRACPTCGARIGYYEGRCLRCGTDVNQAG